MVLLWQEVKVRVDLVALPVENLLKVVLEKSNSRAEKLPLKNVNLCSIEFGKQLSIVEMNMPMKKSQTIKFIQKIERTTLSW
jgi:hypothetical protein